MRLKDFSKIYFTILVLHLAVVDVGESQMLILFTKPLLLLSLIAFYKSHIKTDERYENFFLVGLVFSLVGDVFLMFTESSELWFKLGLGGFLIAQVFYSLAFYKELKGQKGYVHRSMWPAIPFLLYAYWLIKLLQPALGEMLLPVIIYAIALMEMALFALNRYKVVNVKSVLIVFLGAMFFVASDSVLAYTKFMEPFAHSRVIVMATYGIAQFLLVWGMLFGRLKNQ